MNGHTHHLPPFRLPDNFSDRYEIWTVRVPALVQVQDLNGTMLEQPPEALTIHQQRFIYQEGYPGENESYRLLVPSNKRVQQNGDSDSDEEDGDSLLVPLPQPFARHFNLVQALELPSSSNSTTREPLVKVRKSYAPVPQRKDLKRRWVPIGGHAEPLVREVATAQVQIPAVAIETTVRIESAEPRHEAMSTDEEAKRAAKRARKEAKKAKKKAKKSKRKSKER